MNASPLKLGKRGTEKWRLNWELCFTHTGQSPLVVFVGGGEGGFRGSLSS